MGQFLYPHLGTSPCHLGKTSIQEKVLDYGSKIIQEQVKQMQAVYEGQSTHMRRGCVHAQEVSSTVKFRLGTLITRVCAEDSILIGLGGFFEE